jgi:hypothetical protein
MVSLLSKPKDIDQSNTAMCSHPGVSDALLIEKPTEILSRNTQEFRSLLCCELFLHGREEYRVASFSSKIESGIHRLHIRSKHRMAVAIPNLKERMLKAAWPFQ